MLAGALLSANAAFADSNAFSPRELYRGSQAGVRINTASPTAAQVRSVKQTEDTSAASPDEKIGNLSSRANDWREPSQNSEEIYVGAIRQWLAGLDPDQRARARLILRDAHPTMYSLRLAIRDKKAELAALSFDKNTPPETLPRLGQELQALRKSLRAELEKVSDRLKREAGVTMGPLGGDGFWLAPPREHGGITEKVDKHGELVEPRVPGATPFRA